MILLTILSVMDLLPRKKSDGRDHSLIDLPLVLQSFYLAVIDVVLFGEEFVV